MRFQWLLIAALLGWGPTPTNAQDCPPTEQSNWPVAGSQLSLQYAEGFKVEYFDAFKLITVLAPPGVDHPFQYILLPCGAADPDGYDGIQRIAIPPRRTAALSTTQLPHFELLNEVGSLAGISAIGPVYSTQLNQRYEEGSLAEIGHGPGLDLELVLDLEIDLLMATAAPQSPYQDHPLLKEAGIGTVANAEYTEATLLGRAEWIKFTAAFFDKEQQAAAYFDTVVSHYHAYAALTQDLPASQRPTVFGGALWRDTWYISGGQSYPAQLVRDAGGHYLWADDDTRGSLPLDFEAVYQRAHSGDFWLTMHNDWKRLADVAAADSRYADFAAFAHSQVYNANARLNPQGGNDYWERGVVEPHILLADFIKMLHPELLPQHHLKYYQRLD